jgi:hypothetical protein
VNRTVGADGVIRVDRTIYDKVQGLISVRGNCFSARVLARVDGKPSEAWVFLTPEGSRVALEEIRP